MEKNNARNKPALSIWERHYCACARICAKVPPNLPLTSGSGTEALTLAWVWLRQTELFRQFPCTNIRVQAVPVYVQTSPLVVFTHAQKYYQIALNPLLAALFCAHHMTSIYIPNYNAPFSAASSFCTVSSRAPLLKKD